MTDGSYKLSASNTSIVEPSVTVGGTRSAGGTPEIAPVHNVSPSTSGEDLNYFFNPSSFNFQQTEHFFQNYDPINLKLDQNKPFGPSRSSVASSQPSQIYSANSTFSEVFDEERNSPLDFDYHHESQLKMEMKSGHPLYSFPAKGLDSFFDGIGSESDSVYKDRISASHLDNIRPLEQCLFDMKWAGKGDALEANWKYNAEDLKIETDFVLDDVESAGAPTFVLSNVSPRVSTTDPPLGRYSHKVFIGGLPPDIDEDEIIASFRQFGPFVVDWPHKSQSRSYFPPKGYAFLLFQREASVQQLIHACFEVDNKLYMLVSSPTIKNKPVQIRPWRLSDAYFEINASIPLNFRKTVFVGGVPRTLKAVQLAMIMDQLYGDVCYVAIDTDQELKYPKGAARVVFSKHQSFVAAICARFVHIPYGEVDKRVEIKPYVMDNQLCDICGGVRCGGKFAPYFCENITCLQYYCEPCWRIVHSRPGRAFHTPLVKEGVYRHNSAQTYFAVPFNSQSSLEHLPYNIFRRS